MARRGAQAEAGEQSARAARRARSGPGAERGAAVPLARAPEAFEAFVGRFPLLGRAWSLMAQAGEEAGPLEPRVQRLLKLAVAIGTRQVGAVHSGVRKALAAGASREEIEQVVALAASLVGLPAAVAAFGWIREEAAPAAPKQRRKHRPR